MKAAKDRLIFPLDVPDIQSARHYIKLLSGKVGMFKVGMELFYRTGPDIIRMIRDFGDTEIFLDLKLHDIPTTVSRAMAGIAGLGVRLATVHCGESLEMLKAAVSGSEGKTGVLGVTVLTSVDGLALRKAGFAEEWSDVSKLVEKRARMAGEAKCAGVVCSGLEVRRIKALMGPDFLAVTPGIRPDREGEGNQDQKRVTTPARAIAEGADYLVIGRPIRDAKDPVEAANRITAEIGTAMENLSVETP